MTGISGLVVFSVHSVLTFLDERRNHAAYSLNATLVDQDNFSIRQF